MPSPEIQLTDTKSIKHSNKVRRGKRKSYAAMSNAIEKEVAKERN